MLLLGIFGFPWKPWRTLIASRFFLRDPAIQRSGIVGSPRSDHFSFMTRFGQSEQQEERFSMSDVNSFDDSCA
jgi:hypothetical protein